MLDLLFDDDAHGAVVEQLAWRPIPRTAKHPQLAGLWDDGDGKTWWLFDAAGGKTLMARPVDFAVADAGDVRELRWSADGRRLLVVAGGSFRLFDAESRRLVVLAGRSSEMRGEDPRLSPDGRVRRRPFPGNRHGRIRCRCQPQHGPFFIPGGEFFNDHL